MLMWSLAAAALGASLTAAAPAPGEYQVARIRGEQLNNKYRENIKRTADLETALRRFESEVAGKRGSRAARSSKPREIVVVGSKVKDVVRSPRASPGFSDVSGLARESDAVEYRRGSPASLSQLKSAIRRFESKAGPNSPCVTSCRARRQQCLARCRGRLRKSRIKGRCICAHFQAHCLVRAAKRGKCHPPDPGRFRRR